MLIAGNVIASLIALSNPPFMNRNLFHVGPILEQREWHRMVTSGFLHGGILHLFVNMYVLFMFGGFVERVVGPISYIIIYFGALLGGNVWALLENRTKPAYRALGVGRFEIVIAMPLHTHTKGFAIELTANVLVRKLCCLIQAFEFSTNDFDKLYDAGGSRQLLDNGLPNFDIVAWQFDFDLFPVVANFQITTLAPLSTRISQ